MAESYKVLGQASPAAATPTALYTVPGATSAVASSVIVANQNAGAILFRISVAVAGAVSDPKQFTHFDISLAGNSTYIATLGITLAATDVVRVQSDTTLTSFNLFGTEIT